MQISHRDLMHATAAKTIPAGNDWIFELKYDGFRCLAIRERQRVQLLSRRGRDMAPCFPEIVHDFREIAGDFVLDGELVVLDENGTPRFERLARRARMSRAITITDEAARAPAALIAFDLLWSKGDRRARPLIERKRMLQQLLVYTARVRYLQHIDTAHEIYAFALEMQLEGIMAKRPQSWYVARRSKDWLKIKTPIGQERED